MKRTAVLMAVLMVMGLLAGPATASDHQCEGFNTDAKLDVEDFEDGVGTWTDVEGDDGELYTVVGTLSEDGKTISFGVFDADGNLVDGALVEFCLKAGTDPTYFVDDDAATEGSHEKEISNVVVYSVIIPPGDPVIEEDPNEWCSPGFWSQNPANADAAAALIGLDLDEDTYSDVIGPITRSKKGVKDGAPTDPTLREVLNNPSWYGGDAFNAVGDLLSGAAGLEWDDTETATCPFAADASGKDPLTRNDAE